MKFSEIISRLNGVSTPIFGVSWTPPVVDVAVARKFVTFVEARRVLFSAYTNEVPEECVQSVIQIRDFVTSLIGEGGISDELSGPLRVVRRYCMRFLDQVGVSEDRRDESAARRRLFHEPRWAMHDYWFGEALGEMRSGVGMQIARVAAAHGLDVEDELARTLPDPDASRGETVDSQRRLFEALPADVQSSAVDLEGHGVFEFAYKIKDTDRGLQAIVGHGLTLLGGDLWEVSSSGLRPTGDSWHVDHDRKESTEEFAHRSVVSAKRFVRAVGTKDAFLLTFVVR